MPRPRRILFFSLAAVGLAGVAWLLWPRTAITRENVAKVELGMTLPEVVAILGGPARDETTGPTERDPDVDGPEIDPDYLNGQPDPSAYTWQSDRVAILVLFGSDDRVEDFGVRQSRRTRESLLDMLRRWLRL
jgi:hypothetical protein